MKTIKWQLTFVIAIIVFFIMPLNIHAQDIDDKYDLFKFEHNEKENLKSITSTNQSNEEIYDRRLMIKLSDDHSFNTESYNVDSVSGPNILTNQNIIIVKVPETLNFSKKQNEIEKHEDVIYTEPDIMIESSYTQQNNTIKDQWYLNKIDMPRAWKLNSGSENVTVAILDTGVNRNHPSLKNRTLPGYDFVNKRKDARDDHGHGTQVAGIIAANSTSAMTGVDLHASILPVKVIDSYGNGPTSDVVSGIYYAIKQGADVINMSYVNYSYSQSEENALWEAYKQGITLVAAAGNDGWGRSGYPASYTPVISVSSTDKEDKPASFSNYGDYIDIGAPGTDIFTLNYRGGYQTNKGTSFSAPIVSALSGMLAGQHSNWGPEEIEWALESSTKKLTKEEWNPKSGYGRINAYKSFSKKLTYEPTDQNDYTQATKLNENKALNAKLKRPLDMNWFTFNLTDSSKVTVTLKNLEKHIDLAGKLYQFEGNKLQEVLSFDSGKRGEFENASIKLNPGIYYLAIHDIYGKWSQKPYGVMISSNPFEPVTKNFPDVTSYKNEIEYLTTNKIIHGYPDGTFRPYENITRLQAVRMILIEMGIDTTNYNAPDPNFNDINSESSGFNDIATAVDLGIIKGKDNNEFDSYGYLTRAQLAAILVNAYQLNGTSPEQFKDIPTDHWTYESVNTLVANHIVKGYEDDTFRPYTQVSRAHFSVFLFNKIKQSKTDNH